MIKKEEIDSPTSNIFECVDSLVHQTQIAPLPDQFMPSTISNNDNIDINIVLENLKYPQNAAQSLSYLIKFRDLNILLNQKPEIIPHIISFISPNTPDLIIPSLQFLKKCCSFENFPIFLLNFMPLENLIELTFSLNSKQAIKYLNKIISKIVLSIGQTAEPNILLFIDRTDQINNDDLKAALINILYSYLQNLYQYTEFFEKIDFINRLNANLLMLNYPQQLITTLKVIDFCVNELNIPYTNFNFQQVIKLIKCQIASIQILSIKIANTILLSHASEEIVFKNELCKSLRWIFSNGSIKSKLKALCCLRIFIELCSEQFPPVMKLLDINFYNSIISLLSSGDHGSIEAISFLIFLVQDDSHPEFKQQAINSIMDFDIHEQLESLASTGDDMISIQASVLLKMTDKYFDIQSEMLV